MYARHLYNSVLAERQHKRLVRPLRIGVPSEYNVSELSTPVRTAWTQILSRFQSEGHTIIPVSLPTTRQALAAYYVIAPAEASSNLAKYDGVRYGTPADGPDGATGVLFAKTRGEGFGPEVRRRILLGTYSLSSAAMDNYFIQAQRVRRLVARDFDAVFSLPNVLHTEGVSRIDNSGVDVLVCPTAPKLPPTLKEASGLDPIHEYVSDVLTVPASLAGLPAISVPFDVPHAGNADGGEDESTDRNQVSVGMQIIGQFGHDDLVLNVAEIVERWNQNYAPPAKRSREEPAQDMGDEAVVDVDDPTGENEAYSPFPHELASGYARMRETYGRRISAVRYRWREEDERKSRRGGGKT